MAGARKIFYGRHGTMLDRAALHYTPDVISHRLFIVLNILPSFQLPLNEYYEEIIFQYL
jgi:hypothetical protein